MTTTHETIAAFLAAAAPFVPCKACGKSGHAITQCNEIARFDLVTPPTRRAGERAHGDAVRPRPDGR